MTSIPDLAEMDLDAAVRARNVSDPSTRNNPCQNPPLTRSFARSQT